MHMPQNWYRMEATTTAVQSCPTAVQTPEVVQLPPPLLLEVLEAALELDELLPLDALGEPLPEVDVTPLPVKSNNVE